MLILTPGVDGSTLAKSERAVPVRNNLSHYLAAMRLLAHEGEHLDWLEHVSAISLVLHRLIHLLLTVRGSHLSVRVVSPRKDFTRFGQCENVVITCLYAHDLALVIIHLDQRWFLNTERPRLAVAKAPKSRITLCHYLPISS